MTTETTITAAHLGPDVVGLSASGRSPEAEAIGAAVRV